MLSISFADYDCAQRVRSLLRELGAGFDVVEKPIDRTGDGWRMRSCVTKHAFHEKSLRLCLTPTKLKWFYMSCAAALPQLDRGSDYESERHRFESYTPHQLKSKASGNGGFSFTPAAAWIRTSVEARAS